MTDLEEIYVEYFEPVYKFLISFGCDSHSAEEITQETMFIAIQKIDSFKGNCKLSVWLCQIAKNMYFKKRKEGQKFVSDEMLDSIAVSETGSDPEYPHNGELNENDIQTLGYTLVWSRQ